jgi:hypothetical protein
LVFLLIKIEEIDTLKPQNPSRAAGNTLAARQTMTVFYGLSQPGVAAHIDHNRAVECADPTLHTTATLGHDLPLDERLPSDMFIFDQRFKWHNNLSYGPVGSLFFSIRMTVHTKASDFKDPFICMLINHFIHLVAALTGPAGSACGVTRLTSCARSMMV